MDTIALAFPRSIHGTRQVGNTSIRVLATLAVMAIAVLAGCTAAPTDSNGGTDTGGVHPPLTDQARLAALDAVVAKANALTASTLDGRRQELINYMRGRSEIDQVGANEDGSVWAIFTDGRPLTIIANQPDPSQEQTFKPVRSRNVDAAVASGGPAQLPAGLQARILLGGAKTIDQTENNEIRAMLVAKNYTIAPGSGDATLDALKQVQGDAVFYLRGHGTIAHYKNGDSTLAILTATKTSILNDIQYKEDWDSLRIGYASNVNNSFLPSLNTPNTYYAIYTKFVEKYFSFIKDSFVYISTCNSTAGFKLRTAFFDKGAGVYWGWDNVMKDGIDNFATLYIFDRLLGINDPSASPESPKQRPFDYQSIKAALSKTGYDKNPENGAELSYFVGPNGPSGLLAPSIKYLDVDESTGTLILSGQFGDEQPEVRINEFPMVLRSWSPHEIQTVIDASGPYSAGNVVVLSRGRRSNTRVLSEWRPTFNIDFVEGNGTLGWGGPIRLHFRADIASYREEAGEVPRYRTVNFNQVEDTDGDITARGRDGTTTWTGTAHLANRIAVPTAPNVIDAMGEIETQNPLMRLFFQITVTQGMVSRQPGKADVTLPYVWAYADDALTTFPFLPAMHVNLDAGFNLLGDQRREVPTNPSAILTWSTTVKKPPFQPDSTARMVLPEGRGGDMTGRSIRQRPDPVGRAPRPR